MTAAERQQLTTAIQHLAGTHLWDKNMFVVCTVDSVNETEQTCDCTPIGGDATTSIPAVQLTAEQNDGFLLIPVVGSTVIVTYSKRNEPYVTLFSDIDKVIVIAKTSIQFNDGSFGGLVEVAQLTLKLNNLITELQQQLVLISAGIATGGGSYTPGTLSTFTKTDYENTKITHGS